MDDGKAKELENLKLRLELIGVTIQNHQLSMAVLNHKWQEVKAQIEILEAEDASPTEAGEDV